MQLKEIISFAYLQSDFLLMCNQDGEIDTDASLPRRLLSWLSIESIHYAAGPLLVAVAASKEDLVVLLHSVAHT